MIGMEDSRYWTECALVSFCDALQWIALGRFDHALCSLETAETEANLAIDYASWTNLGIDYLREE